MSSNYNDKNAEQSQTGKEIQESIDRAQTALNRLDNTSKRLARQGIAPEQSQDFWDALIDVDMAVMDAYNRIRKYLRVDEDRYWNEYIIAYDSGAAVILGGRDEDDISLADVEPWGQLPPVPDDADSSIEYLEDYQGAVEEFQTRERERFGDEQVVTKYQPKLLSPADYRRAVRVMDEARRKLGFTPKPTESTPRTEITPEMMDEVEEWRQNNLPNQYLNVDN